MRPPLDMQAVAGKNVTVLSKANESMKYKIEALFPHHANGMDWYKTDYGWAREDWLISCENG